MATISRLSVSLTARTRGFKKGMASAGSALKSFVGGIFNVKTAIIGLVGAAGLGLLAKNIIDVNARVQTLKASLKTVTGGTKQAAKAFKLIQKFAATTPFDLEQVVAAFIKLKALGMDPSEEALRSYGNTASAMGKSLNDMIEAVADASTGEFERLKEFGIKAKSEGENVTFTFQKIKTTVGKNATEIEKFLQGIGNENFGSAMDDQAKTLKTAFSNLGDSFVDLKTKVGESGLNDLVASIAVKITEFVRSITPESVKKFTQAIIDMGFMLARFVLAGIVWIAEFIADIGGINVAWLNAQKSIVNFGIASLNIFDLVSRGMQNLFGTTAKQKIESINEDIVNLETQITERLFKKAGGGLFASFYDPDITNKMLADMGELQVKVQEIKNTAGKDEHFLAGLVDKAQGFLGGLQSSINSEIAAAERIQPKIKLKADVEAFKIGSEKVLDELQDIAKGEVKPKDFGIQGRDPLLQKSLLEEARTTNSLLQQGFNVSGAVAG